MGLFWRDSKKIGPARINASSSGLGASLGSKLLRVGFSPRGTYVSANLGFGIRFIKYLGKK